MSLETEVAALTAATTNLLNAVNVAKSTLDGNVATTVAKAAEATASAAAALSIYGNTQAMNTAVAQASGSAATAVAKAVQTTADAAQAVASATQATASAAAAALITYGNLIMHPHKISESIAIPDGFNAFFVGPMEIGPNVTITGLGNSTLRGI